jgi:hypothetical protein
MRPLAVLVLLIALLATACGPSITDAARRAAHSRTRAWGDDDEIRLECAVDEIAVEPLVRMRDPITGEGDPRSMLSADRARELGPGGRFFVAWCPAVGCCGRPAAGQSADAVTVRCTDDGTCESVADNFGDCLMIDCSPY